MTMLRNILFVALAGLLLVLGPGAAFAVPTTLTQQGRLFDDQGEPLAGTHSLRFTIYDAETGGAIVWQDEMDVELDESGFYSVVLGGDGNPIDLTVIPTEEVWLGLGIDGSDDLTPLVRVTSVPYAVRAGQAAGVAPGAVTSAGLATGAVTDDAIGSVPWAKVNDVPADLADGDDDTLNAMSCASGDVPYFDGAAWTCSAFPTVDADSFADSDQSCGMGEYAVGFDTTGVVLCDVLPTYDGTDFALSDQSCPSDEMAVGFDASGAVICDASLATRVNELEEGMGSLPWQNAHTVTLTDTTTDLGDQLAPLLAQYKTISVTLESNNIFTWNTPISVAPYQRLHIEGEGATNGANNLTVIVQMDAQNTWTRNMVDYRDPHRVTVSAHGYFRLTGVRLEETINDTRTLARPGSIKAIFNANGDYSTVEVTQSRLELTENLTNFGGHTYARIKFGHTFFSQSAGAPRTVYPVTANSGWSFAGHGGVVSRSHTTLNSGVSFNTSGRIQYLD